MHERRVISIGSMCSGSEAPIEACKQLRIQMRHLFAADISQDSRTFIRKNFNPLNLHHDIMNLDVASLPYVDLFVAGPPCQPFSKMNSKRLSVSDARISVLVRCLEYIRERSPKAAKF